jgi:hypothetical protein
MEKHVEPERTFGVGVIDWAVTLKNRTIAAGVFVRRTEQGLGQIEEFICRARVSEVNKPAELKSVYVVPPR